MPSFLHHIGQGFNIHLRCTIVVSDTEGVKLVSCDYLVYAPCTLDGYTILPRTVNASADIALLVARSEAARMLVL